MARLDYSKLDDLGYLGRSSLHGAVDAYLKSDQLQDYRPYPKQAQFHMAGARYANRMLRAGNQSGKTFSAAAEMAMHLTGEYPKWWQGYRFGHPITAWAASKNGETTRDNCQRMLLGPAKQIGTGMIPKRCLTSLYGMAKGTPGLYDFQWVRHVSGGMSFLKFRNYEQKREAWQGPPVHVLWPDEEPPLGHYNEGLARTIAVQGISMMTFTPLLGRTQVVNLYMEDPDPEFSGRHSTLMTLYDALHLTREQIKKEIAKWPKNEQRARIYGEPALGAGQIYPYHREDIEIEPFKTPPHWPILCAIDVAGGSKSPDAHPTAAVKLAWDRDDDVVYVIACYRKKGLRPPEHWMRLQHWGKDMRWAWPKDAGAEEKGTGEQIIKMYKEDGMRALPVHAQYPKRKKKKGDSEGSYRDTPQSVVSVERGIMDVAGRLEEGRLRVFNTCPDWFAEMAQYHRDENGKIVKVFDDLMDATRYGIMMLRFAVSPSSKTARPKNHHPDWQAGGM